MFFIIAVEMILPNNSLKKYAKFVLSLILMIIVINPLLKLYNNNLDIDQYVNKASKYVENKKNDDNVETYRTQNRETTLSTFKANLENNCEKYLKDKYPQSSYKVTMEISYEKESILIRSVKVGVNDNRIEKIKKVEINGKNNASQKNNIIKDERSRTIINTLSEELKVSKDVIVVYKI